MRRRHSFSAQKSEGFGELRGSWIQEGPEGKSETHDMRGNSAGGGLEVGPDTCNQELIIGHLRFVTRTTTSSCARRSLIAKSCRINVKFFKRALFFIYKYWLDSTCYVK